MASWKPTAPLSLPDVTTKDSRAVTGECPELVKVELVGDRPIARRAWITSPVDCESVCWGWAVEFW